MSRVFPKTVWKSTERHADAVHHRRSDKSPLGRPGCVRTGWPRTVKVYGRLLYVLAFVVAFIDIGVFFWVSEINEGRIENQTPPLFEFSKWGFVTIYVAQIAVLVVCWWLIRNNPFSSIWGKKVLNVVLGLLVLRGAVFSYGYCYAPTDRARISQTDARLGKVDRALQDYHERMGSLPALRGLKAGLNYFFESQATYCAVASCYGRAGTQPLSRNQPATE